MSLLFNMLSRLVITFLPRSKHLLISWLQSPSAVILEPPKLKSDTISTVFPSISHEVMGPDATIFVFWMLSFKPTFSHVQLFITPWTVALQAPLSLRFSRQEYWSGLLCPPPEDLPNPGIKPMALMSPALAGGSFPLAPPEKPWGHSFSSYAVESWWVGKGDFSYVGLLTSLF